MTRHKPGCTGKKRHVNADDAYTFAVRSVRKTGPVRVYHCPWCNGFHLTSKTSQLQENLGGVR